MDDLADLRVPEVGVRAITRRDTGEIVGYLPYRQLDGQIWLLASDGRIVCFEGDQLIVRGSSKLPKRYDIGDHLFPTEHSAEIALQMLLAARATGLL